MKVTQEQIIAVLRGKTVKQGRYTLAWRTVAPDFTSSHGFRWPFPGKTAVADPGARTFTTGNPCPQFEGDGLCLAKTWAGAASGGRAAATALICAYQANDLLGDDTTKVRVSHAIVVEVIDTYALIRAGHLSGADLSGAYLSGAYLSGANLRGATGAPPIGANGYVS